MSKNFQVLKIYTIVNCVQKRTFRLYTRNISRLG